MSPLDFAENRDRSCVARHHGTASLDLPALQARADAAAAATGLPSGQLLVSVAPTITSPGGTAFRPTLGLRLDPLAMS